MCPLHFKSFWYLLRHCNHLRKAQKATQTQRFVRLQISNLHTSVTDASLKKLFDSFGLVEQAMIQKDPLSGKSTGLGFVE